jgi:SAM-dependent methyltransferase
MLDSFVKNTSLRHRPNHNLSPGPITECQVCGSKDLELVIDLGHQPLCDTLLTTEQLKLPETVYPLRQMWCKNCTLNQIDYAVPGEIVYHQNYPYRTGITRELATYQDRIAEDVINELKISKGSIVVDIGSNDGTLLTGFKNRGMRVIGVEPTNIARLANEAGIETIQSPFNNEVAQQIVESFGKAKAVTATNVFAHMTDLGNVLQGLETLIANDGYFILENHYLSAIMDHYQFDTIYHEHLRSYSLLSLVTLFNYYDFTVVEAKKVSRYGGNIRLIVAKGKGRTANPSVKTLLEEELNSGFKKPEYYERFRRKSIELKNRLLGTIVDLNAKGNSVVGNSCPGRCSTLLNFAGIGPDLMPYIAEQPTSLKLNKFLPGKHIPIVMNQRLFDDQPDYVVLLAWHYAEPITEQLRSRGLRSKLIMPMPEVKIIEH